VIREIVNCILAKDILRFFFGHKIFLLFLQVLHKKPQGAHATYGFLVFYALFPHSGQNLKGAAAR
jgi:hypothetical protein